MYYVYVLRNENKEFYTGYSASIEKRLFEHNIGMNASTKEHQWELVYYEMYTNEKYARKREQSLKKNRRMKTFLLKRVEESLSD